ncbi:MAG: TonB-like protein [Acidobacteriaceae bacterium]|nr:TonB-like protein [Acidobacteriaceae bacterium]
MFMIRRIANSTRQLSLAGSVAVHCLVLILLVWSPARIVTPKVVLRGEEGTSSVVVYLPSREAVPLQPVAQAHSSLRVPRPKKRPVLEAKAPNAVEESSGSTTQTTQAGSLYGSQTNGLTLGHEVRPALPVSGDRPAISTSELPKGIQGDVIVEITIDVKGNVVESKLLKTIGYGIDQKVLATLQNWHFTPATQDGVAISSQQDVYFHFPS